MYIGNNEPPQQKLKLKVQFSLATCRKLGIVYIANPGETFAVQSPNKPP